jgi:DNA-binding CsgD family transcriptional regulator
MGLGLVGRVAELSHLRATLTRAESGSGGVVLLRGEAGVGKTRLLEELAVLARGRDMLVLTGRAWALHVQLSYALLVDAIGPHLRSLGDAERARLVDDLPEVDTLFIDLPRRPLAPLGDPALEKTRLFEAFCRLVERLALRQPVVLLLDDVHWADRTSVEMLHYLCRNLGRSRIVVALSVRAEEPETESLAELLHSLQRAGLLSVSELGRLSHEETLALARTLLEGGLAPSLETLISERTRGVPLLVEELVRSLLSTGQLRRDLTWSAEPGAAAHVPSAMRDLARYRLSRLDAVERRILETLAVDGQGARADELAGATGLGADDLAERLQRLLRERFIMTDAREHYSLWHPLMQQVLLEGLAASARRALHQSLLHTLEELKEGDLGRLAGHYVGAGESARCPRALEVVRTAAERSRALHAHADAAHLLAAAVELARGLGQEPVLPGLYAELGGARSDNADPAGAAESWREAARLYEERGERDRALALAPKIALARSTEGRHREALELLHAAAPGADAGLRVKLAEAEVIIRDRLGDVEQLGDAVAALRRLAAQVDAPEVAVIAKSTEAWVRMSRVQCVEAWQLLEEALAAARACGDPRRLFNVLRERFFAAVSLGDIDAVERNAVEARQVAAEQLRSAPLVSVAEVGILAVAWARGDWRVASQRVPQIVEAAMRAGDKRFAIGALYGQAQAFARSGDVEMARLCLNEAKRQRAEAASVVETRIELQRLVAEGEIRLLEGDVAGAVVAFEEACGPEPGRLMRTEFPVYTLSRLANAYLKANRPDDAFRVVGYLDGGGPLAEAHAACIRGQLRPGKGGIADLEAALAMLRALHEPEVAECCIMLAERLSGPRAQELAEEAATLAEHRNDRLILGRAQARLKALDGGAPETAQAAPTRRRAADGLSSREREVAVLVARGLTNDEIARHLDISPHTVATHLKRMYDRLGFASRVELTRYVLDHHIGE